MKYQTTDLSGKMLDWAVRLASMAPVKITPRGTLYVGDIDLNITRAYSPSVSWEQAGVIAEQHRIFVGPAALSNQGIAWIDEKKIKGDTMLEAAMRCFVYSKFGVTIEIPDDLFEDYKRYSKFSHLVKDVTLFQSQKDKKFYRLSDINGVYLEIVCTDTSEINDVEGLIRIDDLINEFDVV